jgi:hypothetical protein
MTLSIILLTTVLNNFASRTPNLCDDVYLDSNGSAYTDWLGQTLSRYCAWTGPDAAVWDANVCCTIDDDGASCSPTDVNGRCWSGLKMYCEYGAAVSGGGVVCYQPFPSMCDSGLCVQAPDVPPPGLAIYLACCGESGICQLIYDEQMGQCQGYFLACEFGALHDDGTVDCYD